MENGLYFFSACGWLGDDVKYPVVEAFNEESAIEMVLYDYDIVDLEGVIFSDYDLV